MSMLSAIGKISVQPTKGRIVVDISRDFVNYYYWHICKRYWIRMGTPLHGAHITIFNSTHKEHSKMNWRKALEYDKKEVVFDYDENIVEGGYKKGFLMYYMKVRSQELDQIKTKLGIIDGPNFRGLHITLANGKNDSVFPDWPKMIELR